MSESSSDRPKHSAQAILVRAGSTAVVKVDKGAGNVVDALFALILAGCQEVHFVGLCGSLSELLPIGSIVMPEVVLRLDHLSDSLGVPAAMDTRCFHDGICYPPAVALRDGSATLRCSLATLSCLYEEAALIPGLCALGIDCIDLECGAVYATAARLRLRCSAFLVVSDFAKEDSIFSLKTLPPGVLRAIDAVAAQLL